MALRKKCGKKNKKGYKKGDKIHGEKKGKKGQAASYITRAQALAKLQVPLADFRKLCILKGIYPRDPKKKNAGADKTYYHTKDIAFLSHEPILNKFFELKTFMKKFKRLMGRSERDNARALESRKPKYSLSHLVRERYMTFEDAIRDMDDAVSMLALFQALSADQKRDIPTEAINEATRLYQEFQLYVIRAQALRKVFASIKGYYFQAEIQGTMVTWLAPHQFAQEMPMEVDFRVMLTFLEFYRAMVKFVNYKLYADMGLAYPPKRDTKRDEASAEVAALEAEMREAGLARQAQQELEKQEDEEVSKGMQQDFGAETEEALALQRKQAEQTRMKSTFRGSKVFVNREVPLRPVYFVLLCGGVDEVGWERGAKAGSTHGPGSAFGAKGNRITHQVVDRPPEHLEIATGREYVQPQWVFDSFNVGCQLPVALYAPGRAPPPHLSPFVDDKAEGYIPRQRELLDKLQAESTGAAVPEASGEVGKPKAVAEETPEAKFDRFTEELKAETEGTWHSTFAEQKKEEAKQRTDAIVAEAATNVPKPLHENPAIARQMEAEAGPAEVGSMPKPTEEEEERLRAKALMPKKHKRLLQRIEKSKKLQEDDMERLNKKRKQLEEEEEKKAKK